MKSIEPIKTPAFLQSGGEMGELIRNFDWAQTSLGLPDTWPQSLRTALGIVISSSFPMLLWWGNELIQFYNDAFRPSLGTEGKHPSSLGQPAIGYWKENWHIIKPLIDKVMVHGEPSYFEDLPIPNFRNGRIEEVYWTFSYSPVIDESGKPAAVLMTCFETTAQVLQRQTLAESEDRFQNLVREASAAIIVLTGSEMKVEIVNKAYGQLIERTPEELLHKPLFSVIPETEAFYRPILEKVMLTGESLRLHDSPYAVQKDNRLIEGFLNVVYEPYRDRSGAILGVMATVQDVTEQVRAQKQIEDSERALRNFIMQAPIAIAILRSKEYVVEIVNEHALEFWGRSYDEVIGQPLFDALPELRTQGFREFFDGIYDSGNPVSLIEHPIEFKRAGVMDSFYFNFLYQVLYGADGKVNGLMAVGVDMTIQTKARMKIEEAVAERTKELAAANLLLEQNNRELEQFAYIASHDLQEPLRKVSTFTQMLKMHLGEVDEKSAAYFNKITTSTLRMMDLIRDVLDFSQLSHQRQPFETVDVSVLIEILTSDFELIIEQKGAVIHHRNLPTLKASGLQMRQLFGNLLSNALKFTREGVAPVIYISSENLEAEEKAAHKGLLPDVEYCLITVEDNGIGFGDEHAEKIFSIFQRLHGKTEFAGTGIGLALCKKIAHNHHGEIWATSQPDNGATFHIILPCV